MLTQEEIVRQWEAFIANSRDLQLVRQFYTKINAPEKIKAIFTEHANDRARAGLLQHNVDNKAYHPELSIHELRDIASTAVKEDIRDGEFRKALAKLDDPIYQKKLSADELSDVINHVLSEDSYGNGLGSDPDGFAERLIDFRRERGLYKQIEGAYAVLNHQKYVHFVKPELARAVVTLNIFSNIVCGAFKTAANVRKKYALLSDDEQLKFWIQQLVPTLNLDKSDPDNEHDYACSAAHSAFSEWFSEAGLDTTDFQKPEQEPQKDYLTQLHEAFDKAESDFGILVGMKELQQLFRQKNNVRRVGKDRLQKTLQERIDTALEKNPVAVCELLYGYVLGNDYVPVDWCGAFLRRYVHIDEQRLLTAMIEKIEFNTEQLLSEEYSFRYDNLTFDAPSEINNTYNLYLKLAREGVQFADQTALENLIFLKIAIHAKETYIGKGMREIVAVLNEPANKAYINLPKLKQLFEKVFKEGFEEGFCNWAYLRQDHASYFYQFVSSPVGTLFKEDKRLEPYFKLHEFLTTLQSQD